MSVPAEAEPGCGRPCEQVVPRLLFEVVRVRARAERQCPPPCPTCPATNPLVMVRRSGRFGCYRCLVRPEEGHHPRRHHAGPEIPGTDANVHKIICEGERIWDAIGAPRLCSPCQFGCGLYLG